MKQPNLGRKPFSVAARLCAAVVGGLLIVAQANAQSGGQGGGEGGDGGDGGTGGSGVSGSIGLESAFGQSGNRGGNRGSSSANRSSGEPVTVRSSDGTVWTRVDGNPRSNQSETANTTPRSTQRSTVQQANRASSSARSVQRSTSRSQQTQQTPQLALESGMPPAGESRFVPDEVVVTFRPGASQAALNRLVARNRVQYIRARTFFLAGLTVHRYRILDNRTVQQVIQSLEASPDVLTAQPNYLYELAQAGPQKLKQYANDRLGIGTAHNQSQGQNVKIAIIDSMIDVTHPEFQGAQISTHDATGASGDNVDPHGTSIAGIIAANGRLTGVAPSAELIGIAAFSRSKTGKTTGNTWTINTALNTAQKQKANILNLSFAGPPDPLLERALDGAKKRNMIAVAAAGNAGPNAPKLYPAAYESVFAVTATDESDNIYANANRGDHIEFSAPGVQVVTLNGKKGFGVSSGTSLSTAYVSGIAALVIALDPSLSNQDIGRLMRSNAHDLGIDGKDAIFGYGMPSVSDLMKR